jgi:hypothetical protein
VVVVRIGPVAVLDAHVRRFNDAGVSGDFAAMVGSFTADAEIVFEGVPVGPFHGREAIAAPYASRPPTDAVRLLGVPRLHGEAVESDYG